MYGLIVSGLYNQVPFRPNCSMEHRGDGGGIYHRKKRMRGRSRGRGGGNIFLTNMELREYLEKGKTHDSLVWYLITNGMLTEETLQVLLEFGVDLTLKGYYQSALYWMVVQNREGVAKRLSGLGIRMNKNDIDGILEYPDKLALRVVLWELPEAKLVSPTPLFTTVKLLLMNGRFPTHVIQDLFQ